jgi:hypothetical protein
LTRTSSFPLFFSGFTDGFILPFGEEIVFAMPKVMGEDGDLVQQVIFVVSFYLIWVVIMQGIIQGQIVDAFSEMRDKKNKNIRDLEQVCFICSRPRFDFEQYALVSRRSY